MSDTLQTSIQRQVHTADVRHLLLQYDPARQDDWMSVLSAEESSRWSLMSHEGRRNAFLLGRVAARTLLAQTLDVPPEAVPVEVLESGAPDVDAPVHLSIAHSGDHAVASVSRAQVGTDLERIKPRRPDLHEAILHTDEYHLLDSLGLERTHVHILCWTLKEAALKSLRTGLRVSPKDVRLAIDAELQEASITVLGRGRWRAQYEEVNGYYLAHAVPESA